MPARVLRRPSPEGRWVFELGHSAPITGVLVRGDTVLSGAGDGSFLVRTGDGHYQAPDLSTYRIYGAAWDPDGDHAVLATEGGLLQVHPATAEATPLTNPPGERAVYAVASGRGVGVAGDEEGDLWLWRPGGQPELWRSLEATIRSVHVVDEPTPSVLVSDSLGNLRLFDLATGRERWAVTDLAPGDVRAVALPRRVARAAPVVGHEQDGRVAAHFWVGLRGFPELTHEVVEVPDAVQVVIIAALVRPFVRLAVADIHEAGLLGLEMLQRSGVDEGVVGHQRAPRRCPCETDPKEFQSSGSELCQAPERRPDQSPGRRSPAIPKVELPNSQNADRATIKGQDSNVA